MKKQSKKNNTQKTVKLSAHCKITSYLIHSEALKMNQAYDTQALDRKNHAQLLNIDAEQFACMTREEQVQAIEQRMIDNAQVKRNQSASTSTTSKFCRLLESTRQNYRIDRALEEFHSMKELMKITECSEARIKSHCVYIMKNCTHAKRVTDTSDNKRFKFVVAE